MMRATWLGLVVSVVLCAACEASTEVPAQVPTAPGVSAKAGPEDDQAAAELQSHHRHHHAGYVGFILASAESVGIGPDQQAAYDKIKVDFQTKVAPVRIANAAVMKVLADGLAAGTIDQAKLDPALAGVTAAAQTVHTAAGDALNQLHALLRPEQRAALVDKISAHWSIWKDTNAGDQAQDNAGPGGHVAQLQKELGLSDDQAAKVRASLVALPAPARAPFEPTAAEAHAKAFATAFAADAFDAKALTTGDQANGQIAAWGAARMVRFYQAVAPVLTPDQRTKVANALREHANES
jgi:Spy/CpxP family protein refolding chaperone